jgi:hypothetical protein
MLAILMILILAGGHAAAQAQMIDVVRLKDGTSLEGLIVEQEAGASLKMALPDRTVWTLEESDIDAVEKVEASSLFDVVYTDVVFLRDGTFFRGTITEQRPNDSLVLRATNGALVRIAFDEIWKMVKQKRPAGFSATSSGQMDLETEPIRIRLQIEITGRSLGRQQEDTRGQRGGTEPLRQELESLRREKERADLRSADEERADDRMEIETLEKEIGILTGELARALSRCAESQDSHVVLPAVRPVAAGMQGLSADQLAGRLATAASEVASRTKAKLPTEEEIEGRRSRVEALGELQKLLHAGKWRTNTGNQRAKALAGRLTEEQRKMVYDTYRHKGQAVAAVLNAVPFLMIGSVAQGDAWGAGAGYALDLGSYLLNAMLPQMVDFPTQVMETPWGFVVPPSTPQGLMFWVNLAIDTVFYAYGVMEPFIYANSQNKRLAEILQVEVGKGRARPGKGISLAPPGLVLLPDGRGGLRMGLNLLSARY